ncbi:ABC transporter permease [Pontimonas sp.]|jgi:peptide/nickel transport system permease protein|uniref:ABC transporter permease n=1 Tax=Pontimonas sp. TaxID=2304492 RepID=UPI0028701704|nr:ABC transporter permease [Pontimonas sp.]MDR9395960.1 ABC transporter permease [Pontimonas sp.]MDR9434063.1 ABC transporter permease [Pontimonas sp.]
MSFLANATGAKSRFQRRHSVPVTVVLAALALALIVLAAVFPTWWTGQSPLETDAAAVLQPPSSAHFFGTDQSGRDVFSRVIHGARYSLFVGFGATVIALSLGVLIGVGAALAPKVLAAGLSRAIDVLMAFPEFLLALLVIAIVGTGEASIPIAVALAALPAYARVARSETLVVVEAGYIRAARSLGVSPVAVLAKHVVPNILGPLLVMATIGVGTAIVTAAGLSFLGLGPQPPTPEWGIILSEGRNFLATAWWIALFPGLAIVATVISVSTVGRYLRSVNEVRIS